MVLRWWRRRRDHKIAAWLLSPKGRAYLAEAEAEAEAVSGVEGSMGVSVIEMMLAAVEEAGVIYGADGQPMAWSEFYRTVGLDQEADRLPPHGWLTRQVFEGDGEWTCDMLLDAGQEASEAEWPEDFCKHAPTMLCFDGLRIDWFPICEEHGREIAGKTGQAFPVE